MALGSPPLARGTVLFARAISCGDRITPACAGNSIPMKRSYVKVGDHPRLRGEQTAVHLFSFLRLGSPPLARGTAGDRRFFKPLPGITPACAGNRALPSAPADTTEDHPRLRGEQFDKVLQEKTEAGSPPLARGTAIASPLRLSMRRITPACAGNSAFARDR